MREPAAMTSEDPSPKWLLLSILVITLLLCIPAPGGAIVVNCSEPTQPALLKELTPLFNLSAIRPVKDLKTCTNVTLFFTLYGILGVNEKDQLLITYLWGESWWQNEFVSWDPEQCGTSKISLPRNKFWVPDIVINEFIDENTAPFVPYVFLHSDGKVYDSQPYKVVSSCNLDIYTFPFDIQHCHLTFNSYIHQAKDMKVFLGRSAERITEHSKRVMATMGEWELLHIEATKEILEGVDDTVIDELMFHIEIRRRPTLYVVNLLIPSCFLITVDLFSFLLPPEKVDRSSFKMTLILGYTVFLLIMNDLLPITGNTIPLINVFFSLCLALMVASLLETVFITNLLVNSENFSPVPRWVQVLVLQILGRLVCLPMKKKAPRPSVQASSSVQSSAPKSQEEEGPVVEDKALEQLRSLSKDLQAVRLQVEKQLQGNQSSEEWVQVGYIIDRLLFSLYILFISVSFTTIVVIWWFQMKVKSSKLLFILLSLIMHAPCGALNCSEPNPPALLDALRPIFNMSSIRPVVNLSTPTDVKVDFILVGILGVDEKTQILTTYIFQFMEWKNEFVSWEEEQCGSGWITVPRNLLWVPDIVINEFMNKNSAPPVPYTYLYSDGTVLDERPVRVVSSCRLDIYTFPFDIQNCSLTFTSFFHQSSAMTLNQLYSVEMMLDLSKDLMKTLGEWELIGITSKKVRVPPVDDPYEQIIFYIALKRRATLYVMNLLIPSGFLVTVDLLSFMLPPKSVDRSLFKMTLILGYTVFLLIMNDLLPITGNTIPLINVFLSLCLALMVASLLETIVITNVLHNSARYGPVPRWVRLLVFHFLGRLLRIPPKPKDPDTVIKNPQAQEMIVAKESSSPAGEVEESGVPEPKGPLASDRTLEQLRSLAKDLQAIREQMDEHLRPNQSEEDWLQVGFIIDRLLFLLYLLFISVSFITINILTLT